MWGSPRQALGYMYAAQKGPAMARPKWHDAPRGTGRTHWDHVLIQTLLYGPRLQNCIGVERGSELDQELRRWATTPGHPRSPEVRNVEIQLRRRLRDLGLKIDHPRIRATRYTFKDANDVDHDHVVEVPGYADGVLPRSP